MFFIEEGMAIECNNWYWIFKFLFIFCYKDFIGKLVNLIKVVDEIIVSVFIF